VSKTRNIKTGNTSFLLPDAHREESSLAKIKNAYKTAEAVRSEESSNVEEYLDHQLTFGTQD
jgi:hypothetical protein